jgi:glycerophosphoryl diester phosphodiesterase
MKMPAIFYKVIVSALVIASVNPMIRAQSAEAVHGLRPPVHGTYVVAHRGAHRGIPENSLPAYSRAIELGCDFVEIDVRTTRDGRFVSIHNSGIDEYVNGKKGKVRDMTFSELHTLDIGSGFGSRYAGTRIPSLQEILVLCKGKTGIYLDLKDADVESLADTIISYGMEKDVLWYISAADEDAINRLRKECPACMVMPDPGPQENIAAVISAHRPAVLATDAGQLNRNFVQTAHAGGALVISDEKTGSLKEWKRMLDWKTDGIQTDDPEKLIRFLESKRKH